MQAWVVDEDVNGGFRFLRHELSLRTAMQAVLCNLKYGKSGPGYRVRLVDVA